LEPPSFPKNSSIGNCKKHLDLAACTRMPHAGLDVVALIALRGSSDVDSGSSVTGSAV